MGTAALIVAHPGHEVRVFGWYERALPHLFVFTAGSRNGSMGRLSFSRRLAARTGATVGSLFGRYLDRQIYDALLAGDQALFFDWTVELGDALTALGVELVVIDSWQMYNVSHDLVHVMARLAAGRAAKALGRSIEVLEYETAPRALSLGFPRGNEAFRVELEDETFKRKTSAVAECPDLRQEYETLLALEGLDAQRTEVFRNTVELDALVPAPGVRPPYERFGAERVAAGTYDECIRWRDHAKPIVDRLRNR